MSGESSRASLSQRLRARVHRAALALLPAAFRYRHGFVSMEASLANLRRNGYSPGAIVDVGAYEGQWTRLALRAFPETPVLMIEANPQMKPGLRQLQTEIGHRCQYAMALVGEAPAPAVDFYAMASGSSVLAEQTSFPRTVTQLAMQTLDDVVQTAALTGPYFLKLDVQGYELQVLRGGRATLAVADVLLLEVALLEYNVGAPQMAEVVAYLAAHDFVPYDVCGFFRRESDDALFQMDLVFVRRNSPLRTHKRFWNAERQFESSARPGDPPGLAPQG